MKIQAEINLMGPKVVFREIVEHDQWDFKLRKYLSAQTLSADNLESRRIPGSNIVKLELKAKHCAWGRLSEKPDGTIVCTWFHIGQNLQTPSQDLVQLMQTGAPPTKPMTAKR